MVAHRAGLTLATPLGSGLLAGPVLLELLSQPVVFVGLSHFLVAGRHIGEPVKPRLAKPDGQAAGREAYLWLQKAIEQ